jgi:O-antigen/teichoic acid export membrane protein
VLEKVRALAVNLTIYGLGDVATSLVGFLLLPLYVRYLSPADYGALALIGTVEVIAKIVFRWGLDGSFMRLYYDCADDAALQRLASTILFFLLALNGACLAVALAFAPALTSHLLGGSAYAGALALVLLNTFVIGFYFLPFHVLRIQGRARQFSTLTFARSAATLLLRLALVVGAGLGVFGVVLADVVVTAVFTLVLFRWFAPLVRPVFSTAVLADALRFGLPRVPHGLAQQLVAVSDKYLLSFFVPLQAIGIYSIGASFGLTLKFFLSAFEYAWAPFYYATAREAGGPRTLATVATYGMGVLVLLAAGLSAVARDIVRLMAGPRFDDAAGVIPFVAIGVVLQGAYLLTSIGLNLAKRTEYYPIAAAAALAVSVGLNLALIPRFGISGAAWSNAIAYGAQAGVAFAFARRVYAIPYEWGRIARTWGAGALAFAASVATWPASLPPVAGLLLKGASVLVVFPIVLLATGFFRPGELDRVRAVVRMLPQRQPAPVPADAEELAGEIVAATVPDIVEKR